ncbi:MAG: CvpA family protein [Oscillospiraceae bacterium]|nr:CvpA family protein [Oscillospiraceae bacterium]
MGIILDLIIVAIVLFIVLQSAKHGFVRTFIELTGFILALMIAVSISGTLATQIFDNQIGPKISSGIEDKLLEKGTSVVDSIKESLPSFVVSGADALKIDINAIAQQNTGDSMSQVADNITLTVARPIITALMQAFLTTLIFAVLMFLVRFLAKAINKIFNLPIVGSINKILGGCIGVAKGVVIAAAFCFILSTIISVTNNGFFIFTKEAIDSSYIFKYICTFNPFLK